MERLSQHQLLIEESKKRGFKVELFQDDKKSIIHKISNDKTSIIVNQGIVQKWMNPSAEPICDHKHLTKPFFKSLEIPSPETVIFQDPMELKHKIKGNSLYVCKPSKGTNGIGVQLGIQSLNDIKTYYDSYGKLSTEHLLEAWVQGYDLRIQVIDSEIVAACLRLPAYVIGNGDDTLQELIANRKKEIKTQNNSNDLIIDDNSLSLLNKQKVHLNDIIALNKKIQLKEVANMAQGGHAIDVTSEIDPIFHQWVTAIVETLNLSYFALDIITENHKKYIKGNAYALEINSRAEWIHHTFSENKTHDLAKVIIDLLFKKR